MDAMLRNEAHVKNAQYGEYAGKKYIFTHRDPARGMLWGEDIPVNYGRSLEYGKWVDKKNVKLLGWP